MSIAGRSVYSGASKIYSVHDGLPSEFLRWSSEWCMQKSNVSWIHVQNKGYYYKIFRFKEIVIICSPFICSQNLILGCLFIFIVIADERSGAISDYGTLFCIFKYMFNFPFIKGKYSGIHPNSSAKPQKKPIRVSQRGCALILLRS